MTYQPHLPKKHLGQHFLHDHQIIQRIVKVIAPQAEQHLVEIGPGKGALTFPLLECGCQLDVIEFDAQLVATLQTKTAIFPKLTIHHADALAFDLAKLVVDKRPLRLVGNLPYNISTPLLFHFLRFAHGLQDMTFMLQKEVVDRMVANPGTPDYGKLSVMLKYQCEIYHLFDVNPTAFTPPPKVNSSIVQLIPYLTPPVAVLNQQHFAQIVTQAFSQRRKTLRNTLKNFLDTPSLETLAIDPQARAETLTLNEFAKLANQFTQNSLKSANSKPVE
jgi:16S rRNA (adenine1518-N6/adenine1519-N6)-dimethyltransferase